MQVGTQQSDEYSKGNTGMQCQNRTGTGIGIGTGTGTGTKL